MIINHNLSALNTYGQMTTSTTKTKKNMEKLSSGLRINSASDDAAGLAISEKMRGQIRGLEKASTNAQDGISLIQTAEGALNEIHAILQRQRELTVKAANGTITEDDRSIIKEEVLQLSEELNRIASDTEFNTHKLLNGKYSGKIQIGANQGQTIDLSIGMMNSASLGLVSGATVSTLVLVLPHGLDEGTYTIKNDEVLDTTGKVVGSVDPNDRKVIKIPGKNDFIVNREFSDGETFTYKDGLVKIPLKVNADEVNASKLPAGKYMVNEHGNELLAMPGAITVGTLDNGILTMSDRSGSTVKIDLKATFRLTDTDLGTLNSFDIRGLDLTTMEEASNAILTIDEAIELVSSQRAKLGAIQNRLEYAINNLDTSHENLTSAESRIRDVDMAKEMMEMTKNNILQQAAQSMLAQANQTPQNVLQLLR